MVAQSLEQLVRQRAGDRCEYCLMLQTHIIRRFHIEHIHARQHVDDDSPSNLALACPRCNAFKGSNIAGLDAETRAVVPLFNPRVHTWSDHFAWQGAAIRGVTDIGRVTVHVLNMNEEVALNLRRALISRQLFF